MRDGQPSLTARKVALNTVMIGAMKGGAEQLPPGAAEASAQLLLASGAAGPVTVRMASSPRMVERIP